MRDQRRDRRPFRTLGLLMVALSFPASSSGQPAEEVDRIADFLRNADIVEARSIPTGVTEPYRLTLSDGTLTHDAAFNVSNKRSTIERFEDGTFETNFVDSYRYNVAAFRLARLLGLEDAVPVTVERRWNGKVGSLSWWVDDAMTEGERKARRLAAPNMLAWNREIYRVRAFNNLVYDTDRNLGNMLIADWHCWMIDFTRAFRRWPRLPAQTDLQQISRVLLEGLRALTPEAVAEQTAPHLEPDEIEALLVRRDLIVAHFDDLIATRGEGAVVH